MATPSLCRLLRQVPRAGRDDPGPADHFPDAHKPSGAAKRIDGEGVLGSRILENVEASMVTAYEPRMEPIR